MARQLSRATLAVRIRRFLCSANPDLAAWFIRQRRVVVELSFVLEWKIWYAPRIRAILDSS